MNIEIAQVPSLSDSQFKKLADFIQTNVGIKMPDEKMIMVQSRLSIRLKNLNMTNYDDYLKLIFSNTPEGQEEIGLMINQITTNLTNFFRENSHFDFMNSTALPQLAKRGMNFGLQAVQAARNHTLFPSLCRNL